MELRFVLPVLVVQQQRNADDSVNKKTGTMYMHPCMTPKAQLVMRL